MLSIPRDKLKALSGPEGPGERPVEGPATVGSRFYDGTAFSLGNVLSANQSTQGFLLRFDNTPAMDFLLREPEAEKPDEGDTDPSPTPTPRPNPGAGAQQGPGSGGPGATKPGSTAPARRDDLALRDLGVDPLSRGAARLRFTRRVPAGVQVDIFQQSIGRRVTGERLLARFTNRLESFRWNGKANRRGRRVRDGYLIVRYRVRTAQGKETRRVAIQRTGGRFSVRRAYTARETCRLLTRTKLGRPVFGGRTGTPLTVAFRARRNTTATVEVFRGDRLVRRLRSGAATSDATVRTSLAAAGLPRGDYTVRVTAGDGADRQVETMTARRL